MTRRTFVKAGACALVGLGTVPQFLVRAASAAPAGRKILVAVFQRGAVDGLSMVPPHGDRAYFGARRSIAIPPPARGDAERTIDLDGFFGFHPAMAPLLPLWQSGALAAVHACGSPDSTRSHFDAQDYMESGTPGVKSTEHGWLARAATAMPPRTSPFRSVAIGSRVPRTLRGSDAVAMSSIASFDLRQAAPGGARRGFESLYADGTPDALHGTARETFDAVRRLRASEASRLAPRNGATYPRGRFGESMRQIAQLVRADVGLEIAFADVEGWDTHVAQGAERGQLATRLAEFAGALAAFAQDLGDRMADVCVLTMSEFGRTVAENGNRGTDHGHATAMLAFGGGVRGGQVYGRWPGLAREQLYEGRDLAVTTDFRTLFAEVATRHLGIATSEPIFPGWTAMPPLGLFAT